MEPELSGLENRRRARLFLSDVIKRTKETQQQQRIENKDKVQSGSKDIQLANIATSPDETHLDMTQT